MSAGWVAGGVRAAALARRRLGADRIGQIARLASANDAVAAIGRSPYGRDLPAGATVAEAERHIAASLLWNLRVLAGWLPARGVVMARLLAGWFEIANVDDLLAGSERPAAPPFGLGALATAWPRLAGCGSAADVRSVLASSPWGDPGSEVPRAIALQMRLAWAARVAAGAPPARSWAAAGAAILVARERFAAGRRVPDESARAAGRVLGNRATGAPALADFIGLLPDEASWVFAGVTGPADLWRTEARWWARLRQDGHALLATPLFDLRRPLGAMALMAADAWRARAALQVCARSGAGMEVLDASA